MRIGLKTNREEMRRIIDSDILKQQGYDVDCIFDMNTELWGTTYKGIEIVSPFEAVKRYKSGAIDKIVLPGATVKHALNDRYLEEQLDFGVSKNDILYSSIEWWNVPDEETVPFMGVDDYNYLDYLEFHTNDHCNLNCKHCNNYSNLVDGEVYTDYEQFSKDVARLKELVGHVHLIRILGGEPLLNKDTYRFVKLMRETYPYSEIRIVTNGTLIDKVDDRLIQTMKECNVIFDISAYPVMFDRIDGIAAMLKDRGVKFIIGWIASKFRPPLIGEYGYPMTTVDCNCIHLRNGNLARCPIVQYLDYYNAAHGTNYNGDDGIIDLYDNDLTFNMLWKRLNSSFDLCNRCGFWREDIPGENWCVGR
ncbi:MAG: radical SAM protein [Lachnospiraceae bacterium]|nr:radical SAM protein [Lachnospiraceae bacterium]